MADTENEMIRFAEINRTTNFFRDFLITKIKIAYRIMEYLAPDSSFPPEIDNKTKEQILRGEYEDAYEHILHELDQFLDMPNSSWACEELRSNAIELMEHLIPQYVQSAKTAKEARRLELLKELEELDTK